MNLVPQFGLFELIVLAVVALIVVGPKDLPRLMRGLGRIIGKMRRMAHEFQASFDQMARETEMEEMRREIEELKRAGPVQDVKKAVEEASAPLNEAVAGEMEEIRRSGEKAPNS